MKLRPRSAVLVKKSFLSPHRANQSSGRILKVALGVWLWAAVAWSWAAETNAYTEVRPGVQYAHLSKPQGPLSIHVVKFEYHRPDLKLLSTLGRPTIFGLASVRKELAFLPPTTGQPLAAINGDFFIMKKDPYQGEPKGLQISEGQLLRSPAKSACFWMEAGGQPRVGTVGSECRVLWPTGKETRIGINDKRGPDECALLTPVLGHSTRTTNGVELILEPQGQGPWLPLQANQTYLARVREVHRHGNTPIGPNQMVLSIGPELVSQTLPLETGTRLKIVTALSPDLTGVSTAMGGGPILVAQGRSLQASSKDPRNPRTAIGWNDREFYFVVVDGRKKDLSIGVDFAELADLMIELGCQEALNLDGGGSTTLWLKGQVVNHPSENGVERNVANALVLLQSR